MKSSGSRSATCNSVAVDSGLPVCVWDPLARPARAGAFLGRGLVRALCSTATSLLLGAVTYLHCFGLFGVQANRVRAGDTLAVLQFACDLGACASLLSLRSVFAIRRSARRPRIPPIPTGDLQAMNLLQVLQSIALRDSGSTLFDLAANLRRDVLPRELERWNFADLFALRCDPSILNCRLLAFCNSACPNA